MKLKEQNGNFNMTKRTKFRRLLEGRFPSIIKRNCRRKKIKDEFFKKMVALMQVKFKWRIKIMSQEIVYHWQVKNEPTTNETKVKPSRGQEIWHPGKP